MKNNKWIKTANDSYKNTESLMTLEKPLCMGNVWQVLDKDGIDQIGQYVEGVRSAKIVADEIYKEQRIDLKISEYVTLAGSNKPAIVVDTYQGFDENSCRAKFASLRYVNKAGKILSSYKIFNTQIWDKNGYFGYEIVKL